MNKITAKQAAEKWGMSDRTVQNHCINGRISGAERWGRTWMIPADAERPKDGRTKPAKSEAERKHQIIMPVQTPHMLMSGFYSEAGSAKKCLERLSSNPDTASLFEGWLALNQGNLSKALDIALPLLEIHADFYGTLSVGMLVMSCAIWKNDPVLWRTGRAHISSANCIDKTEEKIRDFWLSIGDIGVLTDVKNLSWHSWNDFHKLPDDSLPAVLFYYARYMHKSGLHMARGESSYPDMEGLGLLRMYPFVVEPLIVQTSRANALLAEICIRMLCADAYFSIGMKDAGIYHLDTALNLAVPDKLYGVLAEFRDLLNTNLNDRLDRIDPEGAKEVKRIYKKYYHNWSAMHNRSVSLELSERQREIARLAALGLSNSEISDRLQISYHTVKSTVSMIMNKIGITRRSEFMHHIF